MTGYRFYYPPKTSELMFSIMKNSKDSTTYKRAQCIYLRSEHNYTPKHISEITGLSISRVNDVHSLYKKHGEEIVYLKTRGGRNHYNMTKDEELKFLTKYQSKSLKGAITTVSLLHKDLEKLLSRNIHKSGIYKMLKRNSWRKIMPRPQHPDHDQEKIDTFKKTSPYWLREEI
jgi:transposase